MNRLKIITSTTREGRSGIAVANWITALANSTGEFEVELLDLKEIALPFIDEPNHPRLRKYTYEHTKQWSATIDAADAFIIVLAEYNYGYPAPIKNAIDYLFQEWQYKPVGFVSYGGISAGLRSTQMLKQVVTTLNMMPIQEQVNLPFFSKNIVDGVFQSDEKIDNTAKVLLKELFRWSESMKMMRSKS